VRSWEDNNGIDIIGKSMGVWTTFIEVRGWPILRSCDRGNEPSFSMKDSGHFMLFKKNFVP
jgi:hypothetical protein